MWMGADANGPMHKGTMTFLETEIEAGAAGEMCIWDAVPEVEHRPAYGHGSSYFSLDKVTGEIIQPSLTTEKPCQPYQNPRACGESDGKP